MTRSARRKAAMRIACDLSLSCEDALTLWIEARRREYVERQRGAGMEDEIDLRGRVRALCEFETAIRNRIRAMVLT